MKSTQAPAALLTALLFAALLGHSVTHADTLQVLEPPRRIPEVSGPVYRKVKSIPYPNRSFYISKGILGGIAFGKYKKDGDDFSLFQWQGEGTYFYQPYFSAGVAGKITAGEPSDLTQEINTRYQVLVRFHHAWSHVAVYGGPQLGLDNLNFFSQPPDDTTSILDNSRKNTNPSLGLDLGMGWKIHPFLGLTMGAICEYSTEQALNIRLMPGFAVDLLTFADEMREVVPALYVFVEYQAGYLTLEQRGRRQDWSLVAGLGLAF